MDLIVRLLESRDSIELDRLSAVLHAVLEREGFSVVGIGFPGDLDNRLRRPGADTPGDPTLPRVTELRTEFVRLPGPARPSEFWIAYPAHVATLDTVDRIACAWGKGATEEEALDRADGTRPSASGGKQWRSRQGPSASSNI